MQLNVGYLNQNGAIIKYFHPKKKTFIWLESQLITVTAERGPGIATGNFDKLVHALWLPQTLF